MQKYYHDFSVNRVNTEINASAFRNFISENWSHTYVAFGWFLAQRFSTKCPGLVLTQPSSVLGL